MENEIDVSEISTSEMPSKQSRGRGKSNAWNHELIKSMIQKLRETTELGQWRQIPIQWIWSNLRQSQEPIKYVGYYSREKILETAKELGIEIEAHEVGCKHFDIAAGQVEICFK